MHLSWRTVAVRLILALLVNLACARTPAPKAPENNATRRSPPVRTDLEAGIRWKPGQVVKLKIPMVEGKVLDLQELRGHRVLIELSDQNQSQIEKAQSWFRSRVKGREGELIVVQVVSDDAWIPPVDIPNLRYAWDPDGAVAASLQSQKVPTLIVIDKEGRLQEVLSCRWPECAKQLSRY